MARNKPENRVRAAARWIAVITAALVCITSAPAFVADSGVHAASPTKPAKVKRVKAKAGAGKITISWKKSGKASGYIVYMKGSNAGKYKKIATIKTKNKIKYTKKKLKAGKRYYFKVRAYKKKDGKIYRSKYSKAVSAKVKKKATQSNDPKSPDFSYKSKLPPLVVDENGAYHLDGNGVDVAGAYGLYASIYNTLEDRVGMVPVTVLEVTNKKCTVYYTTDGSVPNASNGKKVKKSSGEVRIYSDKNHHTVKIRGFVNGKEVFHDYFIDAYLYYYDQLPKEDPGPLVGGIYQGFRYNGLIDGLIWW